MNERKRKVLEALIEDYIATAEPVGSRTLARKYELGVSSATIRNEMADLEELGFLEQPHTSAGRVPSDKGYRYYVDQLMKRPSLDFEARRRIRSTYQARVREIHWFIHQTARLVSELTAYPSVVIAPELDGAKLVDLSVVSLGPTTLLLVLRTDAGLIENSTVVMPPGFDAAELGRMAEDFTREFRGVLIRELRERILEPLSGDIKRYQKLWEATFRRWSASSDGDDDKVTLAGPLNILNYPEFRDVDKVRRVLGFLEQEAALDQLLTGRDGGGVQVVIGTESLIDDIQDCSVVTATYQMGHQVVGRLMVLGPRRMHYAQVMTVLEMVSEELSKALSWG